MKISQIAFMLILASSASYAKTLYHKPLPGDSYRIDSVCSPCWQNQRVFDTFEIDGPFSIRRIDGLIDGLPNAINVSVWDRPYGNQLFNQTYHAGEWAETSPYGRPVNWPYYERYLTLMSFAIPELELAGGRYYLSIFAVEGNTLGWAVTDRRLNDSLESWDDGTQSRNPDWYAPQTDAVFTVHGIPEPETYALMAMGLLSVAAARKLRKV